MPIVRFTAHLQAKTGTECLLVAGERLKELFDDLFRAVPGLRGYLVDDQGALRKHVVVFIDGVAQRDRSGLSDPVKPNSEIYVMQALSGG